MGLPVFNLLMHPVSCRFNPSVRRGLAAVLSRIPVRMLFAATMGVLSGCRLLMVPVVVAVGAVGLVGYGVYKTGEATVNGVGSVVSSGSKSDSSLVFVNGEFRAICYGTVNEVWLATGPALEANGFNVVSGNRNALSGHMEAAGMNNETLAINLDAAEEGQTEFRIRIGVTGDLKKSETLYRLITKELSRQRRAQD